MWGRDTDCILLDAAGLRPRGGCPRLSWQYRERQRTSSSLKLHVLAGILSVGRGGNGVQRVRRAMDLPLLGKGDSHVGRQRRSSSSVLLTSLERDGAVRAIASRYRLVVLGERTCWRG